MDIDNDVIYDDPSTERRRHERRKRRDERKRRNSARKKMLGFLWTAKELAPIIQDTAFDQEEVDYTRIAQLAKKQQQVLHDSIAALIPLDMQDERYQLQAGIAASRLIKISDKVQATPALDDLVNQLSVMNDHRSDIIESIDNGVFSEDVLVNIKLNLLPYAFQFSNLLRSLWVDPSYENDYASWLNNTVVALAKDVAFNWDSSSSYRDREALFVMMLPICSELAITSFVEYVAQFYGSSRPCVEGMSLESLAPRLHAITREMDMGYGEHDEKNFTWLDHELKMILFQKFQRLHIPSQCLRHEDRIRGAFLEELDNIAAESWKMAGGKLLDQISKVTEGLKEEEIEELINNEYSEPMEIAQFTEAFYQAIDRWPGIVDPLTFDLDKVSAKAEKKLATLWGLSEATCKIRRK